MIVIGAGLAGLVVFIDLILAFLKSSFRLHVLPIALGLYLPFGNSSTVFVGALVGTLAIYLLKKRYPTDTEQQEIQLRLGLLFCAGIITGEAIAGIIFAIPVVFSGDIYVLSLVGGPAKTFWPGLVLLFVVMGLILFVAIFPHKKPQDFA